MTRRVDERGLIYFLSSPSPGDLHVAIYNLTHNVMHVANARRDTSGGALKAYDRIFIRLNMTELFNEPAASVV